MTGDLKAELTKLHRQGAVLAPLLRARKGADCFQADYQRWYSAALSLVKFLGPDRLADLRDRSLAKDRELTRLEARDLLDGAGWLIRNVF
jgi:hypothetical protein